MQIRTTTEHLEKAIRGRYAQIEKEALATTWASENGPQASNAVIGSKCIHVMPPRIQRFPMTDAILESDSLRSWKRPLHSRRLIKSPSLRTTKNNSLTS